MSHFIDKFVLDSGKTILGVYSDDLLSGVDGFYPAQSKERVDAAVLTQYKTDQRAAINAARTQKIEAATVELDGVIYDANETAKVNISGAVTTFLAMSGLGKGDQFKQPWIAVDDSVNELDGAKIVELGMLVGSKISSIMAEANVAKVALEAAESVAAADAVVAGYYAA